MLWLFYYRKFKGPEQQETVILSKQRQWQIWWQHEAIFWRWSSRIDHKFYDLYRHFRTDYIILKGSLLLGYDTTGNWILCFKSSQCLCIQGLIGPKYRISWTIRRTFFPKKCDLKSTCVLYAEGKYLFPNLWMSLHLLYGIFIVR